MARATPSTGVLASPGEGGGVPRVLKVATAALAALAVGGLVVWLQSLGPQVQGAAVLALALGLPTAVLFILKPLAGLGLYLMLLPLVYTGEIALGLNGGELLTVAVVGLGVVTLGRAQRPIWSGLTALAPILLPIAGLALVSVASMVANGVTAPAEVLSAFFKILAFGFVPLLVYLHAGTPRTAGLLLLALLVGGLLEALYAIGAFAVGANYYAAYDYHRATGTFYTFNYLGAFMALVSIPTLTYALGQKGGRRLLFLAAFALEVTALLLSLTLGSLLGLLVAGVVAGVFLLNLPIRRLAAGAAAFVTVFVLVLAANPFLQEKVTRVGDRVVDRLITYSVGVSMLSDKFWFGFGSQSRVVAALFASVDYRITPFGVSSVIAHASVLTVGVEKGIFGLITFVLLQLGAVWVLVRDRNALAESPYGLVYQGLLVGALAFMVQDLTNNLILHGRLGILFLSVVGLVAAFGSLANEGRLDRPARAGAAG